jgi:hypothetical protein
MSKKNTNTKSNAKPAAATPKPAATAAPVEAAETKKKPTDGLNNATRKAGLNLNVNRFRDAILGQLENSYNVKKEEQPTISGANIVLTSLVENLIPVILSAAEVNFKKDKSGVLQMTKSSISYGVQMTPELNDFFHQYLLTFNPNMQYADTYCIDKKDMETFIRKTHPKLQLEADGYNMLSYLLNCFSSRIIRSAYLFLKYTRKDIKKTTDKETKEVTETRVYGSMRAKGMLFAAEDLLTGDIGETLRSKAEESWKKYQLAAVEELETTAAPVEETAQDKAAKGKKPVKAAATKPVETVVVEDAGTGEGEEEENADENQDAAPEPEPVKPAVAAKKPVAKK